MSVKSPYTTKTERGGYSAIVCKDGDLYVAEDDVGAVIKENSDAATVIQAALDEGGKTILGEGQFDIKGLTDTGIQMASYDSIEGLGEKTILKVYDGESTHGVFCVTGTSGDHKRGIAISNLLIDGNKVNFSKSSEYDGFGIIFQYVDYSSIKNVRIKDVKQDGILVKYCDYNTLDSIISDGAEDGDGVSFEDSEHCTLSNYRGLNNGFLGIFVCATSSYNLFSDIHCNSNGTQGISVGDWGGSGACHFNRFNNVELIANGYDGLKINSGSYWNNFVNLNSYYNQRHGVFIEVGSENNVFFGSSIQDNSQAGSGNYDGLRIENSSYNQIWGGKIAGALQNYGVKTIGTTEWTALWGVALWGNINPAILADTNYLLVRNPGYATRKTVLSPTFAIDSTGVKTIIIPHGLAITPAKEDCYLTVVEDTNVDDWGFDLLKVDSVDATNVTAKVHVSTASATGSATAKLGLRVGKL